MSKPIPYTNFSKKFLRSKGYRVADVELKNCWSGHKNDLFGFGDLLAIKIGKPSIIVQSTSAACHSERRKKILGLPIRGKVDKEPADNAQYCIKCGYRVLIISWKKVKGRWAERLEEISLDSFPR